MIKLNRLNGESFVLNCKQIEYIESMADTKVTMMNKEFFLVTNTVDEIIDKIIEYNAKIYDMHNRIIVIDPQKSE